MRPPRSGIAGPPQVPMAIAAPSAIKSATVRWLVDSPISHRGVSERTRNLGADEDGEDEKRIVESRAHVFWTVGLKSDRAVDAARPGGDICGHEVI